jgi:hypothetical protein
MSAYRLRRLIIVSTLALVTAEAAHAQATPTAPNGASASAPATGYPPKDVILFFLHHTNLLGENSSPTRTDGSRDMLGYILERGQVKEALDKDVATGIGNRPFSPEAQRWIEQNELGNNNSPNNPANNPAYVDFMTALTVIRAQSAVLAEIETTQAILRDFRQMDSNAYIDNDLRKQKIFGEIRQARLQVTEYTSAAIKAAGGGASSDASGSGNSIVTTEEEFANEALDAATIEAAREGDAIARAYIEPTGIIDGSPNHTLTQTEIDGMLARIRLADTAVSSTVVGSIPGASGVDTLVRTTAGAPVTVVALNPIYKNYKATVGPNGALVVTVPTVQVRTPTSVMTIPSSQITVPSSQLMAVPSAVMTVPSTQINVPSTQVNVPSTQVNVPSTQILVPSTQVLTPSSVMSSPDLQPALCGR